jgi:hypothetical protein
MPHGTRRHLREGDGGRFARRNRWRSRKAAQNSAGAVGHLSEQRPREDEDQRKQHNINGLLGAS